MSKNETRLRYVCTDGHDTFDGERWMTAEEAEAANRHAEEATGGNIWWAPVPTEFCPGCGFAHQRGTECEAGAFEDDGVRSASPTFDPFSLLD